MSERNPRSRPPVCNQHKRATERGADVLPSEDRREPFSDHIRPERQGQEVQQLVTVFALDQMYIIRETGSNALLPSGSSTTPGFSNVSELAHLTL